MMPVNVAKEKACTSCCCICCGEEDACFMPTSIDECCGYIAYSQTPCEKARCTSCICPKHQAFQGMTVGRDDICCVVEQFSSSCTKPYWVAGETACYKSSAKNCCFTKRASCPLDPDVAGRCGYCCCHCIPFGCCHEIPPLTSESFGNYEVEVKEPVVETHYLLNACFCCLQSTYIPETTQDGYGVQRKSVCCCYEWSYKCNMLPADERAEIIYAEYICSEYCIKPTTCCKVVDRNFCLYTKYSFPCDDEVPCALAFCGLVCIKPNRQDYQPIHCATKTKKLLALGDKALLARTMEGVSTDSKVMVTNQNEMMMRP